MFWKMRKKYRVKKNVAPRQPKKSKSADLRNYSSLFFWIGLSTVLAGTYFAFIHKSFTYPEDPQTATTTTVVVSIPNSGEEEDPSTVTILNLDVEEIEGLANTIAGRNAIWPGYKGDPNNHRAVQQHFAEQFAKFINSGIIRVQPDWDGSTVAFAYAVSETGVIQFVGKIDGGSAPLRVYAVVADGIGGKIQVIPAQDESGENIIMLYKIKVRFKIN